MVLAMKLKEGDMKIPQLGAGRGTRSTWLAGPGMQSGLTPEATHFSGSSSILQMAR